MQSQENPVVSAYSALLLSYTVLTFYRSCVLCPNDSGALKQTIYNGSTSFVPGTRVTNEVFIAGLHRVSKQRWKSLLMFFFSIRRLVRPVAFVKGRACNSDIIATNPTEQPLPPYAPRPYPRRMQIRTRNFTIIFAGAGCLCTVPFSPNESGAFASA
jgi:hypothetical protein